MSQTNTNTNNGQNRNQISRRGGQGQGEPSGSGCGDRRNGCRNNSIAKYLFEEKMKDGPISKLTITETGHRPSQFKKISDALPVLYADKNFQGFDGVLWTGRDLVKTDFMPPYRANLWSTTHHVQVSIVDPNDNADEDTDERSVCYQIIYQIHVFDANLQKELLSEYERNSKNKSQEYAKFLVDKKALIMILFRQYDEAIKTKIFLRVTYAADSNAERLSAFIEKNRTVCFGDDDGGLSYRPYKQVIAIKSLNTYTDNEPQDPRGFKKQVKIKYKNTKAIGRKIPKQDSRPDGTTQ